ncbi:hypothetical protein QAD02_019179 [Eretmocerus hayati]|uniref:Uncharacterized protein n=1 Tax=Eretmocerus hayati TaxID=131215 RepID=A0ACC2PIV3_9HYME|nr:hypothetical protein QAD02_019179 [Eretmocerus hayati]
MKSPPQQTQCGGVSSAPLRNGEDGIKTRPSRSSSSSSSNGNIYTNGISKVGAKQQLVSLNGDLVSCNSVESEEALACDVAPLPIKPKTKAMCVHIRENKWYDAGNVVSVGVAGATLNEALESMSLAYSPATKQIYALDEDRLTRGRELSHSGESLPSLGVTRMDLDLLTGSRDDQQTSANNSPRGSLGRSCSSTVSSLSECSGSNGDESVLSSAVVLPQQQSQQLTSPSKGRSLWPLNSDFIRNVFSWSSSTSTSSNGEQSSEPPQPQQCSPTRSLEEIGSLALIQHCRPAHLPAKDALEEESHRRQYEAILEAARKREQREEWERRVRREAQLREEQRLAEDSATWTGQVLPRFEALRDTRRVRDLWWRGLPSNIRGRVWKLAIGNSLNVTSQLYSMCLERARANAPDTLAAIRLDVVRTFPSLCVFQEGGPLSDSLQSLLAAYSVYRPDIGYVQGMSFIGAVLALNMEALDAFSCFANLLNRPCHLAAYSLDQRRMAAYYGAYSTALAARLPKLNAHFTVSGLSPDLYLLDWLFTIYAKAMPLDVACRVWDVFLRDGDDFLFRAALGVLHLYQDELLAMDFVAGARFLTRLPENLQADALFNSIEQVSRGPGVAAFQQTLTQIASSSSS